MQRLLEHIANQVGTRKFAPLMNQWSSRLLDDSGEVPENTASHVGASGFALNTLTMECTKFLPCSKI